MTGDIVLTTNNSWLAKAIKFFEKAQTGNATYSHVAICLDQGMLIEALWRVRVNPVSKYDNSKIQIWRLPLSEEDRISLRNGLLQIAGNSYGITKLPLFALDGIATQISRLWGNKKPVFFFTSKLGILNIPVCSQLAVYAFSKFTSYRLLDGDHKEVSWRIVSPDYLQDCLECPHNGAKVVLEQSK